MNNTNYYSRRLSSKSLFFVGAVSILILNSRAFSQTASDIIFTPEKVKTIPGHGMSKAEYPYDESGYYRKEWVRVEAKSKVKSSTTVRQPIPVTSEEHSNYRLKNVTTTRPDEIKKQAPSPAKKSPGSTTKTSAKKTPPPPGNQVVAMPFHITTDAEAKRIGFIGPYAKMRTSSFPSLPFTSNTRAQPKTQPKPPAKPSSARSSVSTIYHKVSTGDTLFGISRKYGVTVDALKKANGLTSDLIRVGQSLRLALAQHALGAPQR